MHIAIELEKVLSDRGVSLYEFSKASEISYQQASDILKNRTKSMSFEVLEKLCMFLNCQIDDVLVLKSDSQGYIRFICDGFADTESVQRLPQTKAGDKARPFLQWVGGKREMIPQYQAYLPTQFGDYYEPFLGGGAMFFHLEPRKAVIADNNPELIKAYEAIRDHPTEIIDLLQLLRRKHCKELYMSIRAFDRKVDIFKQLKNYEIAARMIYLNQTCFNAVYRVNKFGQFNVPIGSSLNRVICDPLAIRKASISLQSARVECADFAEVLSSAKTGDFVYLDPPYYPVSEYSDFTRYTKEKFYQKDQTRLRDIFKDLASRGCQVMLSNSDSQVIRDLYADFNIHTVYSGRNLSSKSTSRGKVPEIVVTSYRTQTI
jgi:DNA adenine methylase